MIVIGLLRGKTKEEWYVEVAKRVANGDGPCAPPEYAEFRGPGVHHNFDDSDSGYDVDVDHKSKGFGSNSKGRIILLGDGTEVLTDSDDPEMFDHGEEDKDLASQVHKGQATGHELSEAAATRSNADPEKTKNTEPKYQGAVSKVLPASSSSNESTDKESNKEKPSSEAKDK
jgi:protein phosphatase 2C family protein 2/3